MVQARMALTPPSGERYRHLLTLVKREAAGEEGLLANPLPPAYLQTVVEASEVLRPTQPALALALLEGLAAGP